MAQSSTAAHIMYSTLLESAGADALPALDDAPVDIMSRLDGIGPRKILEQIATGRLPNEVALYYNVPILVFREWLQTRVPEDLLIAAKEAAAESLQVKAQLVLSANLKNPAEASQAKALSERMAKISESLSPRDWSPAHLAPEQRMPSVSITFDFGAGGGQVTGIIDPTAGDVLEGEASTPVFDDAHVDSSQGPGDQTRSPDTFQIQVDGFMNPPPRERRVAAEGDDG